MRAGQIVEFVTYPKRWGDDSEKFEISYSSPADKRINKPDFFQAFFLQLPKLLTVAAMVGQ